MSLAISILATLLVACAVALLVRERHWRATVRSTTDAQTAHSSTQDSQQDPDADATTQIVSERDRAIAELERREALLNEMGRTAFIGGWESDLVTGRMEWTEIVYKMHDFPLGVEPPLDQVINYYHPDHRERVRELTMRAITKGESFDIEAILVSENGVQRWVRLICNARRENGRTTKLVGTLQDITQQKENEFAMRKREEAEDHLRAQLVQAQRMESIGQLAGGIAHDFNNALQTIVGHAELAKRGGSERMPTDESLDQILVASDHAGGLVRQLLAFSRRQVLKLNVVDLDQLLGELSKMVQPMIGEHIDFRYQSCGEPLNVRADRGQIEQTILNLCVNARDAIGSNGMLKIETSRARLDDQFCTAHEWAEVGEYALITVGDNGCGMDEATRSRIFEPFYTSKEPGSGTGLGLSTAFGIVVQHGGMIKVDSEPGLGSTFTIFLPITDAAVQNDNESSRETLRSGSETILVADDEEMIRSVTEAQLTQFGYTVVAAKDGESAMHAFDENRDDIALAVLDVVMPRGGGKLVAEHISKSHPDLPIIFCSGYSDRSIHESFVLPEGTELIQKPYPAADLLKRVRVLIDATQA